MLENKKTYHMNLKVITPIFIGDGNGSMNKLSYAYNEKTKILSFIDETKLIDLLKRKNDFLELYHYIANNVKTFKLFDWLKLKYGLVEGSKIINEVALYQIKVKLSDVNSLNDIRGFIKSLNKPYIPGSSIKGAIRTAILFKYIYENPNEFKYNKDSILKSYKNARAYDFIKEVKKQISDIEKRLSTDIEDKYNKLNGFSGISISDTSFGNINNLKVIQKLDYLINNDINNNDKQRENYIPLIYECLKENTQLKFTISIDPTKTSVGKATKEIKTIDDILYILNFQLRKMFYVEGKSEWFDFQHMMKGYNASEKISRCFIGGNTGFTLHTLVHALFHDKNERRDITSRILHEKFGRNAIGKHINDKPKSPRTIHIYKQDNNSYFTGICQIFEED